MTIDYHSHCLPGIDDGAVNAEMGVKMLEKLKSQGVGTVCLTPHYNVSMTVEEFLERRERSFKHLMDEAEGKDLPKLVLGAEVHISQGLCDVSDLDKLCYEGTDRMLLELPYSSYSPWMNCEIDSVIARYKISPVMAHVERYAEWYKWPDDFFDKFEYSDAVYQFNVESLSPFFFRMKIKRLLSEGLTAVFGSDTHNMTTRAPRFDLYEKYIDKSLVYHVF